MWWLFLNCCLDGLPISKYIWLFFYLSFEAPYLPAENKADCGLRQVADGQEELPSLNRLHPRLLGNQFPQSIVLI